MFGTLDDDLRKYMSMTLMDPTVKFLAFDWDETSISPNRFGAKALQQEILKNLDPGFKELESGITVWCEQVHIDVLESSSISDAMRDAIIQSLHEEDFTHDTLEGYRYFNYQYCVNPEIFWILQWRKLLETTPHIIIYTASEPWLETIIRNIVYSFEAGISESGLSIVFKEKDDGKTMQKIKEDEGNPFTGKEKFVAVDDSASQWSD